MKKADGRPKEADRRQRELKGGLRGPKGTEREQRRLKGTERRPSLWERKLIGGKGNSKGAEGAQRKMIGGKVPFGLLSVTYGPLQPPFDSLLSASFGLL